MERPVIVSGAGPAGLAAAALLAQENVPVTVISPPPSLVDPRTTALMHPAMQLLKFIGVWPGDIMAESAPLQRLHLVDDVGNLVSAPTIEFAASELGLPEFGWNIPLARLIPALHARALALGVEFVEGKCAAAALGADAITVTLEDGRQREAKLVLAADGVNSPLRKSLGFTTTTRKFDQHALVTNFDHTGSHEFTSTEWHKQDGPFTTVPLPGRRSALVWMARPERIAALAALSPEQLAIEIQLAGHGSLGKISGVTPVRSFPMQVQRATELAKPRVMLIGEAAHAFPPIGAQGLNLSLRDAATAADLIIGAADPGAAANCAEYASLRHSDVVPRLEITGLMNSSLLSDMPAFHLGRALTLSAVAKIPPLRAFAMRQGISVAASLPFAMRG
ncbi:MAG: FAD-dependent monooxygenase [Alphaproteobacteria bacterium]|nr:FAD-dependent monooxygenase [Alphaproteobacteria bacterium]